MVIGMPPYKAQDRSQLSYHSERYDSLIRNTELAQADRVASYLLAIVWSCGVEGVGDKPHQPASGVPTYSAYTSTRPSEMTVPSYAATAVAGMNRKERGVYNNRTSAATKVTNKEAPGSDAHWLKNKKLRQLDIQLECIAAAYVGDTWYFAANNLVIIDSDVHATLRELGTPHAKYQIVYDPTPNMHAEMKILKFLHMNGVVLSGINVGVSKPCCPRCKDVLDSSAVNYTSYHDTAVDALRWVRPF